MSETVSRLMIAGVAAVAGAGGFALATSLATPVNPADKAGVEKIVKEYLLAHPEIIPEAMQSLQEKEASNALAANRAAIETPYGSAWEGAADGDVTLVEFYDYACGYCRQSVADVERLLAEDKKLRVVYREMPVLGEQSVLAARASLAFAKSGTFLTFHKALYGSGRISEQSLAEAITKAGGNPESLLASAANPEADAELSKVSGLQRALNLNGTPAWVVGDRVIMGAVGYDELKAAIAQARKRKSG